MINRLMSFAFVAMTVFSCTGGALAQTTEMWVQQHDGGGNYLDAGFLVSQAPDGNLVVAGQSTEPSGGADLFIRKLEKATGNEIWQFRYDGVAGKDVEVSKVVWDTFGQLLIAGFIKNCVG